MMINLSVWTSRAGDVIKCVGKGDTSKEIVVIIENISVLIVFDGGVAIRYIVQIIKKGF